MPRSRANKGVREPARPRGLSGPPLGKRRSGLDFLPELSTEAQARIESARAARTW